MEILNTRYCRHRLVQFSLDRLPSSENQTTGCGEDRAWSEFFDRVTGGDDYLNVSELSSRDRIYMVLDEERTREDGDVKKVLGKFSDAHCWNTELNKSTEKIKSLQEKETSCALQDKLVKLS